MTFSIQQFENSKISYARRQIAKLSNLRRHDLIAKCNDIMDYIETNLRRFCEDSPRRGKMETLLTEVEEIRRNEIGWEEFRREEAIKRNDYRRNMEILQRQMS